MKTVVWFAFAFLLAGNLKGQDVNYKGPGKMEVLSFWRQAEMFKNGKGTETTLSNMKRSLDGVKQKDPSYSTGVMETEFNKRKDELEKKQANEETQFNEKANIIEAKNEKTRQITQMFNDVTNCIHISIPYEEKGIADFKTRVKSILERKDILAAFKERYKDEPYLETLVNELKSGSEIPLNREINNVVLTINSPYGNASSEETDFKATYYKIQGIQAYWEAAQQMFPEIPECGEAVKKCNELTNKYGTVEKIKAVSKANLVAEIKSRKLPAPVVKDAALEKILIEGFNKKYGPAYNAKAVKAVLTQDGWTIERNAITGIVTGRNRTGKIAYKTEQGDGKCYLLSNNIFIYQAFVGNAFTNSEVIYNGLGGDEMLCENVK
jgi:hypothetical protein